MHALELVEVTKTFGRHTAVDQLNLAIPQGSVYGFIGPNGSGKTTTLRMILRIILPDRGRVNVLGREEAGVRNARIGYLPEERGLYKHMRVHDLLRFHAELKGCRDWAQQIDSWLQRFELTEWSRRRVDALSKGMAQKIQFITAVIARPELLILDEPFSGLDPVNQDVLKDAVLELRNAGTTILFSTHDMDVAERMCDRICMIYRGRKVLDDTLVAIQAEYGEDTLRVRADSSVQSFERLRGVASVNDYGQYQELRLQPGADPQQILQQIVSTTRVSHFNIVRPSLHDIFVRIARPEREKVLNHA